MVFFPDEEHALIIDEASINRAIEKDKLVNVVNKSSPNPNRTTQGLEIRKQKLIASIIQQIQSIESFEQLEAIEKMNTYLSHIKGNGGTECRYRPT